jgi:transposase-like protein
MKKIPPSERIRKEREALLEEGLREGSVFGKCLHKGMQLMMQEMLEAEATEFLGRGHYKRKGENDRGYRAGYESRKVKTAEGMIPIEIPQMRDTAMSYSSKLRKFFKGNTECLEKLAVEMYAKGLSTRDIEDALYEATGDQILSKSSVSRIAEVLWAEYEEFQRRDLSRMDIEYIFLDAIYESIRKMYGIKEAILVAWGIQRNGNKVLLSFGLGNKESYDSWLEFLRDMVRRGLRVPLSITSDGAPGCIKAIEVVYPKSLRIRCWFHKMQNLAGKVPPVVWPELKAEIIAIRDASSYEQGKTAAEQFISRYRREYPSLVACFTEDIEAILVHLKLPVRHRKSVRTTNLIERSFGEERRRTKVIPGFFTEQSCLKLVFSVLIQAAKRWHRVSMGEMELKRIDSLRRQLQLDLVKKTKFKKQVKEVVSA